MRAASLYSWLAQLEKDVVFDRGLQPFGVRKGDPSVAVKRHLSVLRNQFPLVLAFLPQVRLTRNNVRRGIEIGRPAAPGNWT